MPTQQPAPSDGVQIAEAIKDAIIAAQPPRKITFGEFMARKPKRPALEVRLVVNGRELDDSFLTDDEIKLANKLKPGELFDGRVKCDVRSKAGQRTASITYPQSRDARMANKDYWRSFTELLQLLTASK